MTMIFYWINEVALLFAAIVFSYTKERNPHFKKRMLLSAAIFVGLTIWMNSLFARELVNADIGMRIFWYLLIVLFIRFCWKVLWSYAFYFAMWAFIMWQIIYEFWFFVLERSGLIQSGTTGSIALGNILVFVVGYLVISLTFGKWMTMDLRKTGPRQLSSGLLIFWIFEIIGMAQRRMDITAEDSKWELLFLTQILIAVVLYLQNEVFKKSALRQELSLMNLLHKKEQEQYQLSKENIELINQKCHDLKHQIGAIRTMEKEDIEQYLEDVERSVFIYEAVAKTGNEVLDTILTEKSLYCANHQITISCVADGSQLGFINTVDLYSLFGNALDNAIEAVEKFEDKDKRQIDVVIVKKQQFLVINIINPAPEKLQFEEEFPITTKGDRSYHGFGIRSMKYIVKKYDGFLNVSTEDGCFMLEILFPIPKTT